MNFRTALALFAIACTGPLDDKTGDTGGTGPTNCGPGGPYTGPTTITGAEVVCDGSSVRYQVNTEGLTADGTVFSQETGSTYAGGQWADNHDLISYEFDLVCNTFDKLEQELTGGATTGGYVRNDTSVFTCADHYEDNNFMTFAFSVNDASANNVDCFAFGEDVNGMKAGSYTIIGEDPDFDLSGCVAGQEGL